MTRSRIGLIGLCLIAASTLIAWEVHKGIQRAEYDRGASRPPETYKKIWLNPILPVRVKQHSEAKPPRPNNMARIEGRVLTDRPVNTHAPAAFGFAQHFRPELHGGNDSITLRMVIDRHNADVTIIVPEIIELTLAGIKTQPGLVDTDWLLTSLRSILEDKQFRLTCDVVGVEAVEEPYGRCWLPPDENPVTDAAGLPPAPAFNHDIGYQLLTSGLVTRKLIASKEEARLRAAFDDDNPNQSFDDLYRAAEHQARQQELGIWHQYRDNVSTASAN